MEYIMNMQGNGRFYERGLQFECNRCGKCCTGFPGYVYLSENDIKNISQFLQQTKDRFLKKYTKTVHVFTEQRLSLTEKANYDCVFWNKLCTIYPARPYQCRAYPFWKRYLISRREWCRAGEFCPGINNGKLHHGSEIDFYTINVPSYDMSQFKCLLSGDLLSGGLLPGSRG
jgi:Fe-S-cluster containining protein